MVKLHDRNLLIIFVQTLNNNQKYENSHRTDRSPKGRYREEPK